jgi:hypothetical protein
MCFGGPSPSAPPPPPPPADKTSTQIQEEAAAARAINRKRKGYASTILTPREAELGQAPTGQKTLLGE